MKTIIRKELRETAIVAALGIIIFSLMLLQNYRDSSSAVQDLATQASYGQVDDRVQPLLASGFVTQVCFFCAILGAALGWKQIFSERHRDLHAFLIHRPATRSEIFAGKTIAGISLYLLATAAPLLCLVAWVRYPGHLAVPFEWRMAVPAFAFCAAGVVFYFAGMLTGVRQARWYGSRGLGLAAGIVVCLAIRISSSLWQPLLAAGLGIVILAVAAWGAFESSGHYEGQSRHGKVALIISLTVGSAVVLIFSIGLVTELVSGNAYSWTYYSMDTNGVIYKVTQSRGKQPEIVDLEGKPLLDEKNGRMMQMSEFNRRMSSTYSLNVDFETHPPGMFAEPSRYFLFWGATPDTVWYFWSKYGRLIGYDIASRRTVGSIGPSGFAASAPGEWEHFELPHNHTSWTGPNLLNTPDKVYYADLENRSVKEMFKTTNDDPVGGAISVRTWEDRDENRSALAATRRFIHLAKPDGTVAWKIPFEPSYPDYTGIRFSALHRLNQFALWIEPSYGRNRLKEFKLLTHVLWLNKEGVVAKSIDLPRTQAQGNELVTWKTALVVIIGSALISLPLGFWFCRRYAMAAGPTAGWLIFLLFTGVPGLLAFLSVNEWPAKEPCPSCKKLRVVTRERCEHCGAAFDAPPKVGIEIFESASA